ncbi:hypothetical protein LINPERHAP1_LOCUS21013, partial [Linum perenne]
KVIRSVLNRIWGYEGEVTISILSEGLFLIELRSTKLCDWVIARSWHIHHATMILRMWTLGIKPIDPSLKEVPVWITLNNVPQVWAATPHSQPKVFVL